MTMVQQQIKDVNIYIKFDADFKWKEAISLRLIYKNTRAERKDEFGSIPFFRSNFNSEKANCICISNE